MRREIGPGDAPPKMTAPITNEKTMPVAMNRAETVQKAMNALRAT